MGNNTTPERLANDAVILDVRRDDEWDAGHAPAAVHIPIEELPARLAELPGTDGPVPVVCRGGGRSSRATKWLNDNGYSAVNVAGGMQAWHAAGKPMEAAGDAEPTVI
jgi:rhodanese-related sulfurtransferase